MGWRRNFDIVGGRPISSTVGFGDRWICALEHVEAPETTITSFFAYRGIQHRFKQCNMTDWAFPQAQESGVLLSKSVF